MNSARLFQNTLAPCFPQIDAIFFDFDGVILDSVGPKTEAFRELFHKFPSEKVEEFIRYHLRNGGVSRMVKVDYFFNDLMGQPISREDHKEWCNQYGQIAARLIANSPLIPGALEFLESIPKSTQCFVISGTPTSDLISTVERLTLKKYFVEVLGSPVVKAEHVRRLLKQYHLNPNRCLFVGDSVTDFEAAIETGIQFVSVVPS